MANASALPSSDDQLYQIVEDIAVGKTETRSGVQAVVDETKQRNVENLEELLSGIWATVFGQVDAAASSSPATAKSILANLVDFIVLLSEQDDLKHENDGSCVKIHGETIWRNLPMFGWDVNKAWNSLNTTSTGVQRQKAIESFLIIVRFVALLIKIRQHPFTDYELQALWTFRAALETPAIDNSEIDIWIPAIAELVDVLGSQLATSTQEFAPTQPGEGRVGMGGPLWQGRDGFSAERWAFWRRRLEEIRDDPDVAQRVRDLAGEAGVKMAQ